MTSGREKMWVFPPAMLGMFCISKTHHQRNHKFPASLWFFPRGGEASTKFLSLYNHPYYC